jgi:hypothetical protein
MANVNCPRRQAAALDGFNPKPSSRGGLASVGVGLSSDRFPEITRTVWPDLIGPTKQKSYSLNEVLPKEFPRPQ